MSYSIPELSISGSSLYAWDLRLQFGNAAGAVIGTIGFGGLWGGNPGGPYFTTNCFAGVSYGPAATMTFADTITKVRWYLNGSTGSWTAVTSIPAGTYYLDGFDMSLSSTAAGTTVSGTIGAGTLDTSPNLENIDADTEDDTDLPLAQVVTAGEATRTMTKIRYKFDQVGTAGDWSASVEGEAKLRLFG
jgi:hypothetical protein